MALTFADTHNMITYLTKSDAIEGFDQIIDFLNSSSIKKKVIITEATIQEALRLDDAESIDCLPNEKIFIELSRMGAQVGDLSLHSTKYSSHALTQKVFANMRRVGKGFSGVDTPLFEGMIVARQDDDVTDEGAASVAINDVPAAIDEPSIPSPIPTTQPSQPSQDLPSTSQVLPTLRPSPIGQPPSPQQQPQPSHDAEISIDLIHTLLETWGIIANIYTDEDATLKDVAAVAKDVTVVEKDAEIKENADVQGRQAESQAQIYQINLEHADKVLSMQDDELEPVELNEVLEIVTTAKLMIEVVTTASVTITAATTPITVVALTDAPKPKSKDNGKRIMVEEPKPLKKYQALKRKPQTKAQVRKNMMIYLRNMAGFKMDYFKGMSYDDIRLIFKKKFNSNVAFLEKTKEQMEEEDSKALKRASESQAEKAAKKQKLDEEVEELKKHLQIIPNDEDDVYTESTPLARKVPVVDYEIHSENNKPYYKIIRADRSP
nr:hypothetical protein [Tanacetum cinerariifolium]